MNKTIKLITASALMIALVFTTTAFAQSSEVAGEATEKEPHIKHEKMEEVKEALDNRDYETWVSLVSEHERASKILEYINADNFDRFVDMHEALKNKDLETAKEIKEELGLPDLPKKLKKHLYKKHKFQENFEEIKAAMENGDYNTWKTLVSEFERGQKLLEYITEDNFDRFIEMTEAIHNGDIETAKEIHEELGMPMPQKGKKEHFRMGNK